MAVEVRKIETAYAETPVGTPDRVEVTYQLGFTTPSGGWVRMAEVPEAVVQAAEDNAKAAAQPDTGPTDLSQPAEGGEAETFSEDAEGNRVPADPAPAPADTSPADTSTDQPDQPTEAPAG
jgi:hypothetical protein